MKKVWVVGEYLSGDFPEAAWSLIGVFDTEVLADAACQNEECFVALMEINKVSQAGTVEEFEYLRWPRREEFDEETNER